MGFAVALLILGIVAVSAFWLGRGRRPVFWSLAAGVVYLVCVPLSRRAPFDDLPSEAAGNAAYSAGEIPFNDAGRIAAADQCVREMAAPACVFGCPGGEVP